MKARQPGGAFLYGHVAAELRRRIATGVYSAGAKIPSQAQLTREFRVSAITIRRALHDLTYEGLLFGHQGLGVFVTAARRIQRSLGGHPRTIGDEIRRAGLEPSLKELSLRRAPAPPAVSAALGLHPGTVVWRHEKLISADGEPVSLHRLYLPARLGAAVKAELSRDFVFTILDSHGIAVERVDCQFEGAALAEAEAPLFGLPLGFPLIVVHFTPVGPRGVPLLVGETICRADKFTFDVSVDRRQLLAEPRPRPGRRAIGPPATAPRGPRGPRPGNGARPAAGANRRQARTGQGRRPTAGVGAVTGDGRRPPPASARPSRSAVAAGAAHRGRAPGRPAARGGGAAPGRTGGTAALGTVPARAGTITTRTRG